MPSDPTPCRDCTTAPAVTRLGLCHRCSGRRGGELAHDSEPTEAELNRLVSEQMADLPPWWGAASRSLAGEVGEGPRIGGVCRLRLMKRKHRT